MELMYKKFISQMKVYTNSDNRDNNNNIRFFGIVPYTSVDAATHT